MDDEIRVGRTYRRTDNGGAWRIRSIVDGVCLLDDTMHGDTGGYDRISIAYRCVRGVKACIDSEKLVVLNKDSSSEAAEMLRRAGIAMPLIEGGARVTPLVAESRARRAPVRP